MNDLTDHVPTVFYVRDHLGAWRRYATSDPAWAVWSVGDSLKRMREGCCGLVRAEDAAAVDAWLAAQGATVQEVTA